MAEDRDALATLLRLTQAIADQRPNEPLLLIYEPTTHKWASLQLAGPMDTRNMNLKGYPTLAEALEAFILKP